MTADLFGRLLYTDCRAGTGRGAGGGFQVQAQSPGVDAAQSALAVSTLIYEVQIPWLTQQRPVSEFPQGLAHAHGEAGYATGQGRYAGKAAVGGRDGNHLTDCLLTRDADRYGATRPAQLWQSPFWREEPWSDRDCPPLDAADLEPGPLTVEAVADWVRAAPERGPVLARLLTVLEDPAGRRVVIVADSPDPAITWVAAATLLLPMRQALDVTFKVFSTIPLRSEQHRVTAAPAELFPQLAVDADGSGGAGGLGGSGGPGGAAAAGGLSGAPFVLDARTDTADQVAQGPSERALFFAGKLAGDSDPYDVVDAVELAGAVGDAQGGGQASLGDRDAMLTAWALTVPGDPVTDLSALSRWLSGASPALLEEHGTAVAELLLATSPGPPADVLRWIDSAVRDKRLDIDPANVRMRLLAAELTEIRDGGTPPLDPLPAAALDALAHRDAESELSSAILLSSGKKLDLLLCLARRHGIEPDLAPPLRRQLVGFASAWLDHPGGYHPEQWALSAEVLDCARDELRQRFGGPEGASLLKRVNRYFAARDDLTDPLDCHIQASLIIGERPPDGIARLRRLLAILRSQSRSPKDLPNAKAGAIRLQEALFAWHAVSADVAVTILTEMPDALDIDPGIAERAAVGLSDAADRPTAALLNLLASLDKRGKAPASGALTGLLEADRHVRAFVKRAADEKTLTEQPALDAALREICQADPAVVRARLDDVLTACVQARHPQLGAFVLRELPSPLPRQLVARWGETLGSRSLVADGLWCVYCLDYEELPGKRQDELSAALRSYAQRLPQQDFDAWYGEVERRLPVTKRDLLTWVFPRETGSRPWINRWRNAEKRNVDGGRL